MGIIFISAMEGGLGGVGGDEEEDGGHGGIHAYTHTHTYNIICIVHIMYAFHRISCMYVSMKYIQIQTILIHPETNAEMMQDALVAIPQTCSSTHKCCT